ncbi:MAG: T9SS type A sorting domain-containing protein [Bacteroidota bacterium]
MKSKPIYLLWVIALLPYLGLAQSIERTGVFNAAASGTIGGTTFLISIGEPIIGAYGGLPGATLGFQQPIDQTLLPVYDIRLAAQPLSNQVQLDWNISEVQQGASFQIIRAVDQEQPQVISVLKASEFQTAYQWRDEEIPPNTTLRYLVSWTNAVGQVFLSNWVKLDSQVEGPSISLYPNPTSGDLTLNISNLDVAQFSVAVYDLRGRKIYMQTSSFPTLNWDTQNWGKGIYQVVINAEGKRWVEKIQVE